MCDFVIPNTISLMECKRFVNVCTFSSSQTLDKHLFLILEKKKTMKKKIPENLPSDQRPSNGFSCCNRFDFFLKLNWKCHTLFLHCKLYGFFVVGFLCVCVFIIIFEKMFRVSFNFLENFQPIKMYAVFDSQ